MAGVIHISTAIENIDTNDVWVSTTVIDHGHSVDSNIRSNVSHKLQHERVTEVAIVTRRRRRRMVLVLRRRRRVVVGYPESWTVPSDRPRSDLPRRFHRTGTNSRISTTILTMEKTTTGSLQLLQ